MVRKIGWSVTWLLIAIVGFFIFFIRQNGAQLNPVIAQAATMKPGSLTVSFAVTQTDAVSQTASVSETAAVSQTAAVTPTAAANETTPVSQTEATSTPTAEAATPPAKQPVGAVGVVDLITKHQVVMDASGKVSEVKVEVGDKVAAGDLLVALDTTDLQAAVKKAEMNLETARLKFEDLSKGPEASDIALAEAKLGQAQQALTKTMEGPTTDEIKAAESNSTAAWAAYNDLKNGPTASKKIQAQASLKAAELTLQQAQRAYDKISWQPDAGTSAEGAALQKATIDYESAKAAYDDLIKPPTTADLQSALSTAYKAQDDLAQLKEKPTAADVNEAKANVAVAQATLDKTKEGPTKVELRTAEIAVESALIDLDQARKDLNNAQLKAPIAGTVLAVNLEPGQVAKGGDVAVVMADTNKIKLVVNVEQKDISRVKVGQSAEISVYALPGKTYKGVVEKIAPVSSDDKSFVGFPVTLRFTDSDLSAIIPGMTASATFSEAASQ
ncbi:MAG: efflux RND transporter periplasmic adaptor subunit [Caldilineaceae bacterium]